MARLGTRRRLPLHPLVLTVALVGLASSRAEDVARLNLASSADAKSIVAAADDIAVWQEAGETVYLLRGKVLVEQGMLALCADRAVAWVSSAGQRPTRVQLVLDGNVRVEDGAQRRTATTLFVELTTKQRFNLRDGVRNPVQRPQGADPFFRRALALRPTAPPAPANAIQQASATEQAPPSMPVQGSPPVAPAPQPGTPLPPVVIPGVPGLMAGPPPANPNAPPAPPRTFSLQRRTASPINTNFKPLPTGENAVIFDGGVILNVRGGPREGLIDIEADRVVVWTRGDSNQLFQQLQSTEGHTGQEFEVYLEGNVEIRSASGINQATLRADRVYYDVHRNVAVAISADLELRRPGILEPLHLRGTELYQLTPKRFEAIEASVYSSRLPSDPGLQIVMARATVEDIPIERKSIFGTPIRDPKTGEQQTYTERLIRGEEVQLRLEDVPIFYLPFIQGDANDPLGPLQSLGFKNDRIFGAQVYSTFDVWNLINRNPVPGTRWSLEGDYLSRRGPALGTNFEYAGRDLFGLPGPYAGLAKLYGIHDTASDILGGGRGEAKAHPDWRGRVLLRHNQTFLDEFTLQAQMSLLSDKNFLEQYYKQEFDSDVNQQTFLYFRQVHDIYSWSALFQPHVRNWITEDVWLPRGDASVLGRSFFDLFTYNATASAGYAELRPAPNPPPTVLQTTDRSIGTGRFDVNQELSLPFYLGPVRMVPYGMLDLTYYSDNLNNDSDGRLLGGGGVRSSLPLSRLYPNAQNDLFNVNGLYHKVVVSGNYFIARSSDPHTDFAQLDRLNDEATDQALRDFTPKQPIYNPTRGAALASLPLYDPQRYAIRRLVESNIDSRDTIEVLQGDVRQRWQTKRGYPGQEHVVDFLTLDMSASFFPHPDRDNFGKNVAFLEYDTTWNVGDRTALVSSGWYDPIDNGARVFTVGAFLNRPDRTSFFLGYRFIDPIESRAVTTAATYLFSPKYAMTASSTYDFGINQSLANSMVVTRMGSDLTLSLGFTYNALLRNFGFTIEVIPNVVAMNQKTMTGMLTRSPLH